MLTWQILGRGLKQTKSVGPKALLSVVARRNMVVKAFVLQNKVLLLHLRFSLGVCLRGKDGKEERYMSFGACACAY